VDSPSPARVIGDLAKAHIAARCLHVAAAFGVADAIGEQPTDAREIAARTGLDADALRRVLRLLAAHGVFEEGPHGYSHNAVSRLLRSDHPESLRSYVRMTGMPAFWGRFTELGEAAKTGRPSIDWRGLLAYFDEHRDEAQIFNAAMVAKSRAVLPAIVDAYDFARFKVVADVGGGRGHLLAAILARAGSARGVLFELPHVAADASHARSPRLEIATGDFFVDPLPVADLYVLMDLLHDWGDEDAARILANVRRAARAHARLLIVETLVPDVAGPHFGKTLDIIMLAVTGGRERTHTEHAALLERSGFRLGRVLPTSSEYSIIEALAD
jgi:SAM-dependent methyltransferase